MFAAHEVPVGVVVDLQQVPTLKHEHRKLAGERKVHYRPKAPSPVLDGSKGCLRPLVDTHERCCFIAPDWPRGYGWKVGDVTWSLHGEIDSVIPVRPLGIVFSNSEFFGLPGLVDLRGAFCGPCPSYSLTAG